jgi:DNA-binding SARP family transcriptional activator/DNA polymerase III delta prime subunit
MARPRRKRAANSSADVVGFSPAPRLSLRVLGEIEIRRGAERLELPQSKKTRALLAYLVVTQRPQRRERLCAMFWDVADDPRAALRWSLSKLRSLVDETGRPRIVTSAGSISFALAGVPVDLFSVREQLREGGDPLSTARLVQLAGEFRGEFLEGLELPDFLEFQIWCGQVREEARGLRTQILRILVERLADQPEAALPYARTLAELDPLNEDARVRLMRLLAACGRHWEAEQQFEATSRLLRELGAEPGDRLRHAWEEVRRRASGMPSRMVTPLATPAPEPAAVAPVPPMIGRDSEWQRLLAALDDTARAHHLRVVLLNGEPGIGKTRLLGELIGEVGRRHGTVLEGAGYEAETSRPYGPWIDALRRLPPVVIGTTLGAELAPLLPELGAGAGGQWNRDRLFGAVVELIAARTHSAPPVLLVLDDLQWCDDASAELLHYAARMHRHRPVLVALAARDGELLDNEPMLRVLRSLRRDGVLDEIDVAALTAEETAALISDSAPGTDPQRVFAESAGNPLFALEVARSLPHRQHNVPATLRQLVRDRVDRLPPDAGDVLRWSAVLGQTFPVRRLAEITPIDAERMVSAVEVLARHGLLRPAPAAAQPGGAYAFSHDVVRQVVYGELSEPRRRLMHLRIVKALQGLTGDDQSCTVHDRDCLIEEVAHHAALAGEAEIAARACLGAGRRCLRLFAGTEADAMARRGIHYAQQLGEPEQVKLLIELAEVRYAAQRPRQPEDAARAVEALAHRALDHGCMAHARLGFHLLSYLRWEGGDWSDAERHMMRAEQVSRSADERERVVAVAEAARCLTLLERDLSHADALLLEAGALSARLGIEPAAIPDAIGMLRLHQGRLEEAAEQFVRARDLCRREQDRLGEFRALEHLAMLAVERERIAEARQLSEELVLLAERLREGSEVPFARALVALCRYATDAEAGGAALDTALADLRVADAKQRLGYLLTRAAEMDLRNGNAAVARRRAEEALQLARLLERPSDIVLARAAVAAAAALQKDDATVDRERAELNADALRSVSAHARATAEHLLRPLGDHHEAPLHVSTEPTARGS